MRNLLLLALALGTGITPLAEAQDAPAGVVLRKRHRRAYDFWLKRTYPSQTIPDGALMRALGEAEAQQPRAPLAVGGPNERWVNIGPTPMFSTSLVPTAGGYSGRISCLAVNPLAPDHWLAGPGIGGVWETFNAGITWTPLTDHEANLAMGAIAFSKSDTNTIYVGTGEGHGSNSYPGEGILKSSNGGQSWTLISTNEFAKASFSEIRVSPTDKNLLYAATLPPGNADGVVRTAAAPPTGFFRSTDGGTTWARTLDGDATDIEVDPADFNGILTALGKTAGDAAKNDVYRSTDGGSTWKKLLGPWVASNAAGRIEIALAPSNADIAYVSVHDFTKQKEGFLGVWKSDDVWASDPVWTKLNQPPSPMGDQWGYDHDIIVDPTDATRVFLGGVTLFRLDGTDWTPIAGHYVGNNSQSIHPDQQALIWSGSRLIVGNDGGVFSTTDNGASWNNHNTTLASIQAYHGSVHPTRPDRAIIGAQDNSCSFWRGTNSVWQELTGGDGADSAYSHQNPDTRWLYSDQQLAIYRTTDAGASKTLITTGLPEKDAPFVGRFVISPVNEDIALAGHTKLFRCNDTFSASDPTWTANGPDTAASVSAIAFGTTDTGANTYAFGTEQGELRMTVNGGTAWRDIADPNVLPTRYVNNLIFHPTDANRLYVVYSGFNDATPNEPGHVFRTSNALDVNPTWTRIGPAVNIPHNVLAIDPGDPDVFYLGNDLGVWRSQDAGSTWTQLGRTYGFPNVPVFDLEINAMGRVIAFTHGRSAFTLVDDNDRRLVPTRVADKLVVSFSALTLYPELQVTSALGASSQWFVAPDLKLDGANYVSTNAISDPAMFFRLATE